MKPRPFCLFLRAAELPEDLEWLGAGEKEHLSGLRLAKRRAEWLLGRWTAKQALVLDREIELGAADLDLVEILPTPSGEPQILVEGVALPIALSLSHRASAALCAVAKTGSVGCDLEWVEERSSGFIEDYFNPPERRLIEARGAGRRALMANAMWSAKESVLKLLGLGLSVDTRSLTVSSLALPKVDEWQPFTVRRQADSRKFGGWCQRQENWVLTVATDLDSQIPRGPDRSEGGRGRVPAS